MGMSSVISELGLAKTIGSQAPDPLENVPEVMPVTRLKVIPSQHIKINVITKPILQPLAGSSSNANAEADEIASKVPFNLDNLRQHLAQVALARRVLPEDVASRQKLLEESVYQVALSRQKHQLALFEDLGLNNHGLKHADLQTWMWTWHQKLKDSLQVAIKDVIDMESQPSQYQFEYYISLH
jgi:DNA-directed RNA polymerase, mitochondrial